MRPIFRNLLPYFFDKNFVKVTILSKKLPQQLRFDFTKFFFQWEWNSILFWQNFVKVTILSKRLPQKVDFTKFFSVRVKFHKFYTAVAVTLFFIFVLSKCSVKSLFLLKRNTANWFHEKFRRIIHSEASSFPKFYPIYLFDKSSVRPSVRPSTKN